MTELAYREAVLKPMTWEEFPPAGAEVFRAIKTSGVGEASWLTASA
ncbi:hypothetical protein [Amycolatopsis sp.]|nr:hypothetical protein [Amycolatopsis sp.]HET6706108.1 hypothetical protein [Amycolatopsis sp.]